jgi:hypothetical protein
MLKWTISLLVMALGVLIFWSFLPHTRDFQVYQYLKMPHISERPGQRMLVVRVAGDPNVVGRRALFVLYQTFYALKFHYKKMSLEATRVRWLHSPETPAGNWEGIYGLPVLEGVLRLPKFESRLEPRPSLETWDYGTVAEILHSGPYNEEEASLAKLRQFITEQGYRISGPSEEEFLKGPGFFGRGDPKKYQTLLRFRVEKIPPTPVAR